MLRINPLEPYSEFEPYARLGYGSCCCRIPFSDWATATYGSMALGAYDAADATMYAKEKKKEEVNVLRWRKSIENSFSSFLINNQFVMK